MSKSNVAEKNQVTEVAEIIAEINATAALLHIVKEEPVVVEVRKLTVEEKIQRVEDLSLLIDRYKSLNESRRKLQTFQIGADSLSSQILLKDAAGYEFKTSNSEVVTAVIEVMKKRLEEKVSDVEAQINL